MTNSLEELKEPFLAMLDQAAITYKLIGMGTRENPMWLQLHAPEWGDECLMFKSSQSGVFIKVACSDYQIEVVKKYYNEAYEYFRRLKYDFLKEHHLDLYREIRQF